MVSKIDLTFAMPVSPAPGASPLARPVETATALPTDHVTLGASPAPRRAAPLPASPPVTVARPSDPLGQGEEKETVDLLSQRMVPVLQRIVPQSVLSEVEGIMSGSAQHLGQPAPVISPAEATLFLAGLGLQELSAKITERVLESTGDDRKKVIAQARALIPVLEKAALDGKIGELIAKPPPELNAFADTYLTIGIPTPEAINREIASHPPRTPAEALRLATGRASLPGQAVQLFVDGKTAYPEMERLIRSARHSLLFQTFVWHDDETGRRMADLLIARKSEGIDIRVIYDSVGQNTYAVSRPKEQLTRLAQAGIEVHEFNRDLLGPSGINLSHRKMIVADGKAAMTGGMNVGDDYSTHWHDAMVRLDGTSVKELAREFAHDWKLSGASTPLPIPPESGQTLRGTADVSVTVTSPREDDRGREIRKGLLAAVDTARKSIWIENPYFSDARLMAHLVAARQRGVEVNVILPQGNDEKIFVDLNAISARKLTAAGAHVHMIDTGADIVHFNHTKMCMVDDAWVMMGSANMDARSYEENQEITVGMTDPDLARDIHEKMVGPDLLKCVDFRPGTPPANAKLLEVAGTFL